MGVQVPKGKAGGTDWPLCVDSTLAVHDEVIPRSRARPPAAARRIGMLWLLILLVCTHNT